MRAECESKISLKRPEKWEQNFVFFKSNAPGLKLTSTSRMWTCLICPGGSASCSRCWLTVLSRYPKGRFQWSFWTGWRKHSSYSQLLTRKRLELVVVWLRVFQLFGVPFALQYHGNQRVKTKLREGCCALTCTPSLTEVSEYSRGIFFLRVYVWLSRLGGELTQSNAYHTQSKRCRNKKKSMQS